MSLNKKIVIGVGILCVLIGIVIIIRSEEMTSPTIVSRVPITDTQGFDAQNATYTIDGKEFKIVDGISRIATAPGSATEVITRYFGNEATGDINSDSIDDKAFLITQETGGSGVFYYVVAAIKNGDGYKLTPAYFIGDRIAPQTTEIRSGELMVNYADRKAGEPMTTQPSVGKTLYLKVNSDGALEKVTK